MNATLFKITMYVTNFDGILLTEDDWNEILSDKLNSISLNNSVHIANVEIRDIDWDDDLEINKTNASNDVFETYFE